MGVYKYGYRPIGVFVDDFTEHLNQMQTQPFLYATGGLAATGVVCTLTAPYATNWTFVISGIDSAGVGTIAIQTMYNANVGGTYQSITTPAWNALAITATSMIVLGYTGPLITAQIYVTVFTSGTLRASIMAS